MTYYILQLLKMDKKKIAVLIGSLQVAAANSLALLQLYGTLRGNLEIKGKTEIYLLPFISKLTLNDFVQELDILNVNLTSQISLYL